MLKTQFTKNNAAERIRYIRMACRENMHNKYLSYHQAIYNCFKYRNMEYEAYNLDTVKKFKTSDTVFITGAGPSINLLSDKHIKKISQHDSFGINYSFLKKEIVPTYLQISYEKDWGLEYMVKALAKRRNELSKTVFFLHDKCLFRLAHPRTTPEFFPEKPKCCFYKLPASINLEEKRPFSSSDFDKTVFYRGTITLVLELVLRLGYKQIVLLGVDPDKLAYFFEDIDEMKGYCDRLYGIWEKKDINVYENMVPKGKKLNAIDVYFYALKDYLLKKRDVNLFVGFNNNMLYPGIPAYFE